MPISNIIILGGGMCGVASAIALASAFPPASDSSPVKITVYELRSLPSTIGGAVNLTPSAARCLDILGVLDVLKRRKLGCQVDKIELFSLHTAASMGVMDYRGPNGTGFDGYKGWRIMRSDLLEAMLTVAEKLPQVELIYNKKVTGLEELADSVIVKFQDGTSAEGGLVLGTDGIHSATRMQFVEPTRVPTYSGIVSAYGFAKRSDVMGPDENTHFESTGMYLSRWGAILNTYCTEAREKFYVASIMEQKEQVDKEGWRAQGEDQKAVKENLIKRFGIPAVPSLKVKEMLEKADEWFFYPVFILPPNGKWTTQRVILLGEAAHAMPPRGESIGYALEDAIIFSKVLQHFGLDAELQTTFEFYEAFRRKTIEDAYKEASFGWNTNKDSGWLFTKIMEWLTPLYLWWTAGARAAQFSKDPKVIPFPA